MGDAVLFYSLDPDLKINPRSLHGGCAVHKGEKWVATKWIHEKPFAGRGYPHQ
jgi:prolyl 4-hydroxylase